MQFLPMLLLPAVFAICVSKVTAAQEKPRDVDATAGDALPKLARYLNDHGRAAYRGESITTYASTLTATGVCDATLRTTSVMADKEEVLEYTLRLGTLSPEVEARPWTGQPIAWIRLRTTSGAAEIPVKAHRVRFSKSASLAKDVSVVVTDIATADTAARLAGAAINVCGGRPQEAALAATQRAKESAARAQLSALTGGTLKPEQREGISAACGDAVRRTLRAPSSATFTFDASVLGSQADGWVVSGEVEAENAVGGRLKKKFSCVVEAFGKQFVAKTPVLY